MTHPPVPPNSPHFTTDTRRPDMTTFNFEPDAVQENESWHWYMDELSAFPGIRRCIAAVARCAWLDEAQCRASAAECSQYKMVGDSLVDAECHDNAEAWRVWGMEIEKK